jgi:hypothetical protein
MCALCRFSYSRRALVIHCLFAWARSIPERTEGRNDADVPQNQAIWDIGSSQSEFRKPALESVLRRAFDEFDFSVLRILS